MIELHILKRWRVRTAVCGRGGYLWKRELKLSPIAENQIICKA